MSGMAMAAAMPANTTSTPSHGNTNPIATPTSESAVPMLFQPFTMPSRNVRSLAEPTEVDVTSTETDVMSI